jgi:hypothetical protein
MNLAAVLIRSSGLRKVGCGSINEAAVIRILPRFDFRPYCNCC